MVVTFSLFTKVLLALLQLGCFGNVQSFTLSKDIMLCQVMKGCGFLANIIHITLSHVSHAR